MIKRLDGRALLASAALATLLGICSAAPAQAQSEPAAARKTVNVNQASTAELARLPRIGPALAQRILDHRTQHGPFKRAEDLMEVKGVGEKVFVTLKPYVSTAGPTTLTEKVSSGSRSGKKGASPRGKKVVTETHPTGEGR